MSEERKEAGMAQGGEKRIGNYIIGKGEIIQTKR